MSTKVSGPGKEIEVLPAWISRAHTLTGKDWVKAMHTQMARHGLVPDGERGVKGYTLKDLFKDAPMEYETSLRMLRTMWSQIHIKPGACALSLGEAEELADDATMPSAFCNLIGHHSARGWFTAVGRRMGVPAIDLRPLGRWKPKETLEDYARDNRTGVLQLIKKLTVAVKEGARIDESLNVERAIMRGGPEADVAYLPRAAEEPLGGAGRPGGSRS